MENELLLIWEHAPIGIAKVSKEGRFLAVNPRYCEIVGYSETELLSKTFQSITHPDDLDADVTEAEHLSNSTYDTNYQMSKKYLTKDGRSVWYVWAVRDDTNRFKHFIAFAIELTPAVVSNGSQSVQTKRNVTIIDYLKENPKQASLIAGILILIGKGDNIIDILTSLIKQ